MPGDAGCSERESGIIASALDPGVPERSGHAFFGLALLSGSALLLADWYGAMGWGTSAIADQQTGGGIAWSVGEIPTVILAIAVAIMWSRSDERESKRRDRQADRDGDAELEAYNEMLLKRASR